MYFEYFHTRTWVIRTAGRLPRISWVTVTPDIWGDRYPGNSQVGCVSQLRVSHLTPYIRFDTRLTRFEPNASQMAQARLSI